MSFKHVINPHMKKTVVITLNATGWRPGWALEAADAVVVDG